MNSELKKIKKIYGERMMHLCRTLFPTILEHEGLLLSVLTDNIAPSHSIADAIIDGCWEERFKDWVYSFVDIERADLVVTDKTPSELMEIAGYTLYECYTEEDIQSFRKYYAENEVICTITNGDRLKRCYVFFAVKKNVDNIHRKNFPFPRRDDEYGTSVISIQFSRGKNNTLSIKNRYNHTVNNPDSTFGNNLENIIPGLTKSFEYFYGFNIEKENAGLNFLQNNSLKCVLANDGKFYHYNIEIWGIYYCENNIIIRNGQIDNTYAKNKERYILIDQFLIDTKAKTIEEPFSNFTNEKDSFINSIYDLGKITDIQVIKDGENRIINITLDDNKKIQITIDKTNSIIGYENSYIEEINDNFLFFNIKLENLSLKNVKKINNNFLRYNDSLTNIFLPNVQKIGNGFIANNDTLTAINLPNVLTIGNYFLADNARISQLSMPHVKKIGCDFLYTNKSLKTICLEEVEEIDTNFLSYNRNIESVILPNVQIIGSYFMSDSSSLKEISLPNVIHIGDCFIHFNENIENVYMPKVVDIGAFFLSLNKKLESINLPMVQKIGEYFLEKNRILKHVSMPALQEFGKFFLNFISNTTIYLPSLSHANGFFLIDGKFQNNRNLIIESDLSKKEGMSRDEKSSNKGNK